MSSEAREAAIKAMEALFARYVPLGQMPSHAVLFDAALAAYEAAKPAGSLEEMEGFANHWHREIESIGAMLGIGAPDAGEVPRAVQALIAEAAKPAGEVVALASGTQEYVLRAMAMNYGDGPHSWDFLDKEACQKAADEIRALRTTGWRCFHCGEFFADEACARLHFGTSELQEPLCTVTAERYRDVERQLESYRNESDATARTFYDNGHKSAVAERDAEQKGYDRGIADAKAHPETLGLVALAASPVPSEPSNIVGGQLLSRFPVLARRLEAIYNGAPKTTEMLEAAQALDGAFDRIVTALTRPEPALDAGVAIGAYVLIKRGLYWRPDSAGYTSDIRFAGIYSEAESAGRLSEDVTREALTIAQVNGIRALAHREPTNGR